MAPTNYQVANTERLLGPKRREAADVYIARMKRIDEATSRSRERGGAAAAVNHDNVINNNNAKTVRFREDGKKDDSKEITDDDEREKDGNGNRVEAQAQRVESRGMHAAAGGEGSSGEDVTRGQIQVHIDDIDDSASSSSSSSRRGSELDSPPLVVRDVKRRGVVVETNPRIRALKSDEALLPLIRQPRLRRQESRIDTSLATAATSESSSLSLAPSRNGSGNASSSSSRSRRENQVSRIYFSPIDVNGSVVSFTDPYISEPSPEEDLLTPTQERYNDELRWSDAAKNPPTRKTAADTFDDDDEDEDEQPVAAEPKLMLKPEQVDRLVKALAECPLLHVHVSKQWWDNVSDATSERSGSEATPSLTASSSFPSTLSSPQNPAAEQYMYSPSAGQEILEDEFAREYPNHPQAKAASRSHSANLHFGGIALVDPKVHGAPIRFVSKDYQLGSNTVKVGQCSFLTLPYGTTVQSHLRIEPPSSRSVNCRVMMQVVNQVLERKTGRKAYLLVAELDVTESFTRAALMELAAYTDMSLDDIELLAPGIKAMHKDEQLDWCALADELQTSCAITDAVEGAAGSFAHLTAENCTMQTLTLMSELERLKVRHQDFLVLRATGHHDNGVLSGVHIPWTSQHLDQLLYDSDPNSIRGEASKAARLLRDRVAAAVAEGCAAGRAFDSRVWWGDQMRLIHCVPLMEGAADGLPAAWAAFLSGESGYLPY
ncbi:hypothetical protein B0A55_03281 [Friedmanniomyces simplex]|uniref:Uncharacterized protein n=1 Tax=Friedmanniomyces simplex TaxID=329884 RepID=A0A4U0XLE2_9PEZI|nr:hypothetical protein B0A55_03281 [Friedmanniomyces simplex]